LFEITKALANAQDAEHRDEKQVSGRDADPAPYPSFRNGTQEADQIAIACGSSTLEHREGTNSPLTLQIQLSGQIPWDAFNQAS
jgi:hypothetical protein